jgi:hypothetical protein
MPVFRGQGFEPSFVHVDALPAVFLDDPPGVIGTVKNLRESPHLFLGGALKKFRPAMFPEDAIKVGILAHDFDDDHAS